MHNSPFPKIVSLDAITCAVMGLLLIEFAGQASALLAIPAELLSVAGWLLLPVAALMALAAIRRMHGGAIPLLIVIGNVAWVIASIAVLALVRPNGMGTAFVLVQAAVVAIFAWLEWRAVCAVSPSRNPA